MGPTIPLLAAGLFLAQAGDAPVVIPAQGTIRTQTFTPGSSTPSGMQQGGWTLRGFLESRPVLSRMQSLFRRAEQPSAAPVAPITTEEPPLLRQIAPAVTPAPAPAGEFPKKLPTSKLTPEMKSAVSTVALTASQANKKSPISPKLEDKIGRDEKFEWVTGQLEKEGGVYKIYYATPETVDPHQGVIQLNPAKVDMSSYRNGDLVSAQGQLVQRTRMAPIYQVTNIDLIERPKR